MKNIQSRNEVNARHGSSHMSRRKDDEKFSIRKSMLNGEENPKAQLNTYEEVISGPSEAPKIHILRTLKQFD